MFIYIYVLVIFTDVVDRGCHFMLFSCHRHISASKTILSFAVELSTSSFHGVFGMLATAWFSVSERTAVGMRSTLLSWG